MVILGSILVFIALLFSDSFSILFKIFPNAVLGFILFFGGSELAVVVKDIGDKKSDLAWQSGLRPVSRTRPAGPLSAGRLPPGADAPLHCPSTVGRSLRSRSPGRLALGRAPNVRDCPGLRLVAQAAIMVGSRRS